MMLCQNFIERSRVDSQRAMFEEYFAEVFSRIFRNILEPEKRFARGQPTALDGRAHECPGMNQVKHSVLLAERLENAPVPLNIRIGSVAVSDAEVRGYYSIAQVANDHKTPRIGGQFEGIKHFFHQAGHRINSIRDHWHRQIGVKIR